MAENEAKPDEIDEAGRVAGVLAEFDDPEILKDAAARVREEGYARWDAHSPFPIHGIERAMGIRPTILPWLVLGAGIAGALVALLMQWYLNATSFPFVIRGYPHIISGKPLFSLPANIPVTFELIVLFSGLTAFGGALLLNQLPQFTHPVFSSERFRRATSDRFFISIDAEDPTFDASATPQWLGSLGATAVETYYAPTAGQKLPSVAIWGVVVLGVLALLPPLFIARARLMKSGKPRIHLVSDMDSQPRYGAQAGSRLFEDGRAMRPQVEGTLAVGQLQNDGHFFLGKVDNEWTKTFPARVVVSESCMERGQERFNIYCATCHGLVGDGKGMVAVRALERMEPDWATPTALSSPGVWEQPAGQIFNTITNGAGEMPAYAAQIPVEDRWAIVLYVRALQRSQHADIQDVPEEKRGSLR